MSERAVTSLERLRETVALRVQATSLRTVARQVGMSPTGLEKFLAGETPYSRQVRATRTAISPRLAMRTLRNISAPGAPRADLPPARV